jgi:hypothetical protein
VVLKKFNWWTEKNTDCTKPTNLLAPGVRAGRNINIKAVISAPTEYSIACAEEEEYLLIDGRESSGGFGRDLLYKWSFSSTNDQQVFLEQDDEAFGSDGLHRFKATMLKKDTIGIQLEVKNYLGQTDRSEVLEIKLTNKKRVHVKIMGPKERVITASSYDTLQAILDSKSCMFNKSEATYTWKIYDAKGEISNAIIRQFEYQIKPGMFEEGTYTVTFRAENIDNSIYGQDEITLKIVEAPGKVVITGGDIIASVD